MDGWIDGRLKIEVHLRQAGRSEYRQPDSPLEHRLKAGRFHAGRVSVAVADQGGIR